MTNIGFNLTRVPIPQQQKPEITLEDILAGLAYLSVQIEYYNEVYSRTRETAKAEMKPKFDALRANDNSALMPLDRPQSQKKGIEDMNSQSRGLAHLMFQTLQKCSKYGRKEEQLRGMILLVGAWICME